MSVSLLNGRYNRKRDVGWNSIDGRYRLTGDRKWQEKGWKMFTSWISAAKSRAGVSSIEDVTKEIGKIRYGDNMESFAFAETFKCVWVLVPSQQIFPSCLALSSYR